MAMRAAALACLRAVKLAVPPGVYIWYHGQASDLTSPRPCISAACAGDCYIASCGILSADEDGYSQVAGQHDPKDSMARMFAFAKVMLAASRLVR